MSKPERSQRLQSVSIRAICLKKAMATDGDLEIPSLSWDSELPAFALILAHLAICCRRILHVHQATNVDLTNEAGLNCRERLRKSGLVCRKSQLGSEQTQLCVELDRTFRPRCFQFWTLRNFARCHEQVQENPYPAISGIAIL